MVDPDLSSGPDLPAEPRPRPRRWGWTLLVLTAYPLLLGALSAVTQNEEGGPMLQPEPGPLLMVLSVELVMFGLFFAVAWIGARPTAAELALRRQAWGALFWRGFLYSIGLRFLVMVVGLTLILAAAIAQGGPGQMDAFRAHTEVLVDAPALAENPLYLWLNLTVVSFLVAGLREELWRAGMLASLAGLFPSFQSSIARRAGMILLVSLVFGLGHLPQGIGGVVMTTVLGFGLGAILVWRRSLWEACLAHGFFNATTFLLLYLLARFAPDQLPGATPAAALLPWLSAP